MKQAEINFANKSRIIAIPANPATARGYSANLVLDEFAIHEHANEIWAAIYPSITNPMSGQKKLRILSTPKGRGNKFADLWEHNQNYSKHKTTIVDAFNQGLKVNLEELRAGVDDPDIWDQEFMCEFIDSSAILLPYDMIGLCECGDMKELGDAPLYVGMDIGRSHDISVIVVLAKDSGTLYLVDMLVLKKVPYRDQLAKLVEIGRENRVQKVSIDATGIGSMLAEEAALTLGGKVEQFIFNNGSKNEIYSGLRRKFEDRLIRIPILRELREDLHAIQKNASSGGNISYSAPRNSDGHSDRASALALAIHAANQKGCYVSPIVGKAARLDEDERKIA